MRGIILAAGQGTRLRPLTDDKPKCLVEYRGKPILDYSLESMHACGMQEIIVVTGYRGELVKRPGVVGVENPDYAKTNMVETLFSARDFLRGDIIVSYGDIVYGPAVLKTLIDSPHDFAVAVDLEWQTLWLKRMEDPLQDAETLKFGPQGGIVELGKKPHSLDDIEAQYMGLIKISAAALPEVIEFYDSLDRSAEYDGKPFRQMYMTSFIQLVIDNLMPVYPAKIKGGWLEIDSPQDLEISVEIEAG